MNNNVDKFEELFRKELEQVKFEVNPRIIEFAGDVLRNFSLAQLGADIETFESIAESVLTNDLNLYNASYVLNGISSRSANDLSVSLDVYINLQKLVVEESKRWNEQVAPIRAKLMNKLQVQHSLQAPKNGQRVNPNLRRS